MKHSIRLFVIALTLVLTTSFNFSSAQIFNVGDLDLNAQIGFGTTWYLGGTYYKASMPLISIAGDYALIDTWGPGVFGVGALVGVSSHKWESTWVGGSYGYRYTDFFIVPRATYHYSFVDKLDTYGGVAAGIDITIGKEFGDYVGVYTSDEGVSPVISVFAGAKYYFTDNFAVMSEIYVYDLALFNIGVSLKL